MSAQIFLLFRDYEAQSLHRVRVPMTYRKAFALHELKPGVAPSVAADFLSYELT